MAGRLILDTGVIIAAERSGGAIVGLDGTEDVSIAAVTAAELLVGVEYADARNRIARQEFIDNVLALVPVEDYGLETARVHARLMAYVRRSGKPSGPHDLMIVATAVATARTIVTTDMKAAFDDLPGVHTITVKPGTGRSLP